jgi:hypothetical protein
MVHVQEHATDAPASGAAAGLTGVHVAVAFGNAGHGAGSFTQCFALTSQLHGSHAPVVRRSQTESPAMQGSVCTQLSVGSQYSPAGQFASAGVCTHLFVVASHESFVQGTPSSQFIGLPVGTQKPPVHVKPPVGLQSMDDWQSVSRTHVAASAGGPAGPLSGTVLAAAPESESPDGSPTIDPPEAQLHTSPVATRQNDTKPRMLLSPTPRRESLRVGCFLSV